MSEYDGDPPCNFISSSDKVFIQIRVTCSNENPANLIEKVDIPYEY